MAFKLSPFHKQASGSPFHVDQDPEVKNKITGKTPSEQNEANKVEKKKQVNNSGTYEAYMKARAAKKAWEKANPDKFGQRYPGQAALDAAKKAYRKK